MGDTEKFLTILEDMLPPDHDLLLWFLHPQTGEKKSYFTRTAGEASLIVQSNTYTNWHVHYGIGTRQHQSIARPSWRGKEQDVIGLFGVHIDIDVASPIAHKVHNLPPDVPSAMKIIEALPTPPTIIIHSGFGLHVLYLFKECEMLDSTADRIAAKDAVARVQNWARKAASAHGWALDATHDLARVLRLPGTKNHKSSPPAPCVILSDDGPRYRGLSDFLDEYPPVESKVLLTDEQKAMLKALTKDVVCSDQFVKLEKFNVMLESHRAFKQTWTKERRGMTDYSQSGYDMALACICLKTERWNMQEVASLLIQYRAKYGKPTREAYLHFTLQWAQMFVQGIRKKKSERVVEEDAAAQAHEDEEAEETAQCAEANQERDTENLEPLYRETAEFLEFPDGYTIRAVYKIPDIPPSYALVVTLPTAEEDRILITAAIMYNPTKLYEATWNVTQGGIRKQGRGVRSAWIALFNRLRAVALLEPETDTSLTEVVRSVLRILARDGHDVTPDSDPMLVPHFIRNSETFTHEGVLSFAIQELVKCGAREIPRSAYTSRNYTDVLKTIGGTQKTVNLPGSPRAFRRRWYISRDDIGLPSDK